MSKFRPCIDIHQGKVKQIVGSTLQTSEIKENFCSAYGADYFANLYKRNGLNGGHVIMLGAGNQNQEAVLAALSKFPGGLQVGGGINTKNAEFFLKHGAAKVIITSYLFDENGKFLLDKLKEISTLVGRENLVVDLSSRFVKTRNSFKIFKNKWQSETDLELNHKNLTKISQFCSQFLIHAVDSEGTCSGMDENMLKLLSKWQLLQQTPICYAGGIRSLEDMKHLRDLSDGLLDFTVGSALDIFGGNGVKYDDCLAFNLGKI